LRLPRPLEPHPPPLEQRKRGDKQADGREGEPAIAVWHHTPAFEQFFYQAIKDHILADGRIDAEEAAWLRRMLFADNKIDDEERKFLHELKGETKEICREFEALFEESMKQPPEQRTCGPMF
jgi:hypothetical protein